MKMPMDWLLAAQNDDGSLPDTYPRGKTYLEMTGYCIPTLLDHNRSFEALACGQYLLEHQNEDGSFNGLDGIPRAFDTGACLHGLKRLAVEAGFLDYEEAFERSLKWLRTQVMPGGKIRIRPDTTDSMKYTALTAAFAGFPEGVAAWRNVPLKRERAHYELYYLEACSRMGYDIRPDLDKMVKILIERKDGLLPFEVGSLTDAKQPDLCATLQLGCLLVEVGDEPMARFIRSAVTKFITKDGGIPVIPGQETKTWAVKYWLDLETRLNNFPMSLVSLWA